LALVPFAWLLTARPSDARADDPRPEPEAPAERDPAEEARAEAPSPLLVDYAQYGVAFAGDFLFEPGAICPGEAVTPCILGIGGGPVFRGGYRSAGPWYVGGSYEFAKVDSNNLYRLGIMQQLKAEARYYIDVGSRFTPFATWAVGGVVYGNEFSGETGGVTTLAGAGVELEITRFAVVGLSLGYAPMLFVGFEDTAGQQRDTGVAHFVHFDLGIELRTELGRE
jgi:hypothetical protein